MIKTVKIKKMIEENDIEVNNFTLVIRLKQIIIELNQKIKDQNDAITLLKKDSKTTKIN
jgi:hypothetical protein